MTEFEIICRLCDVARLQADIIEKQAEALAQANISDQVTAELKQMRDTATNELELIRKECN